MGRQMTDTHRLERNAETDDSLPVTIFLGCGFAAKYPEGGGNFSVPLQWMLGLRRLELDAIWLELLPATADPRADEARIRNFQRHLREHGLPGTLLPALSEAGR